MSRTRKNKSHGGSGMLSAISPSNQTPSLPGGLSSILPNDNWGRWSSTESAYQWGPHTSAPAALANGGLYTNPQSTAPWASSPFPATQHAFALESAKISGLPEVAYHQRPNDNSGASFSPVVGTPITSNHSSASGPAGPIIQSGGKRNKLNNRMKTLSGGKRNKSNNRKITRTGGKHNKSNNRKTYRNRSNKNKNKK